MIRFGFCETIVYRVNRIAVSSVVALYDLSKTCLQAGICVLRIGLCSTHAVQLVHSLGTFQNADDVCRRPPVVLLHMFHEGQRLLISLLTSVPPLKDSLKHGKLPPYSNTFSVCSSNCIKKTCGIWHLTVKVMNASILTFQQMKPRHPP